MSSYNEWSCMMSLWSQTKGRVLCWLNSADIRHVPLPLREINSHEGVSDMLLVLSTTFHCHYNIWGCMYSTSPFQFRWLKRYLYSSCYYHHQIGGINPTHCYHIFSWLCTWDVCYIKFCHLLHIHSEKNGVLVSLLLCSLWGVHTVGCVLACR